MQILLKLAAWGLIAAVAFATVGPPRYRPMTELGQDGEHALAFVAVGFFVGLAYARRPWLTAAISVVSTGLLELAQFLAPGRHARLEDFIVDAAALCIGLTVAAVVRMAIAHWRGGTSQV
jgi:VanZ family protein